MPSCRQQLVTHADEDKVGDTLPVHNDTSEQLVLNPLGSVCAQNSVVAELPQGHKTFALDRAHLSTDGV